jgi:hypothetical protein
MRKTILLITFAAGVLRAQEVVAPTRETVGSPRGENTGNYNITQSFETGYRWHLVDGNLGMYRTVNNYGNGLRLLGSSLSVNSRDGHGNWFDEILLNTLGLGNDPYESASLRVQKNGLYRYDMLWRMQDYYSPGLTVAAGAHLRDTSRRIQDHDITLLPQSKFRFRVGYSRNTENGPALSSAQEFDPNGPGFPTFMNVRREWNEYRVGGDIDYKGLKLTITHRWDYFKEDSPYSLTGAVGPATAAPDQGLLQQFQRSEPIHGSNPGWFGNLYTKHKFWAVNARMTYAGGDRNFINYETASGIDQFGGPANRVIVVGGNARRPFTAGDFNLSLFPSDRVTIVNNTSITSNHISGDSSYSEVNTGLDFGTTVFFRYLGVRMVTNATDVNFRVSNAFGVYGGYQFSDRLIRTVEGLSFPAFANSEENDVYEVSNRLHTGRLGLRFRPWKPVTINLDGEIGRANNPLTPISEKNYHTLNARAQYRTRRTQISGVYRQVYNLNPNPSLVSFSSHSRNYTGNASWSPHDWFALDAAYTKLHLDTVSGLAFFAGTGLRSQLQTGFQSLYTSNIHAGNLSAHFTIRRRADLFVGYSITKDTGGAPHLSAPLDPIGTLLDSVRDYPLTYQSPMARLSIRFSQKVRWNVGWQYYNYAEDVHFFNVDQNYRAHTGYTSLLWSF